MNTSRRLLRELARDESLELLGTVPIGRVVFSLRALPAIRVVNHVVDSDAIFIRTHDGAAIVPSISASHGTVVAYEADRIDVRDRSGWSVIVTGTATIIDGPAAAHYREVLDPWIAGDLDHVIRIEPQIITGYRLVPTTANVTPPPAAPASAEPYPSHPSQR